MTSDLLPHYAVLGTPLGGKVYLSIAHLWATCVFVTRSKALGSPPAGEGLFSQPAHFWATSHFVPSYEPLGTLQVVGIMWTPGLVAGHC